MAFTISGKFFSIGHQLTMCDRSGQQVAFIKQKLLKLMPSFELYKGDQLFATINKEFTWFKNKFKLDVPGPNDYAIEGSFWDYEYHFERLGRTVARVSKTFWSMRDVYGVEIVDGEDDVAILATIAVIDLVCHEKKHDA